MTGGRHSMQTTITTILHKRYCELLRKRKKYAKLSSILKRKVNNMDTKNYTEKLWEYLNDTFEPEEIENVLVEFELDATQFNPDIIEELSDEDARALLFDLAYMAVNGLFGGDFHTWNEVLYYSLEFDEETIDFLNY